MLSKSEKACYVDDEITRAIAGLRSERNERASDRFLAGISRDCESLLSL
jgi:hypothetical protein